MIAPSPHAPSLEERIKAQAYGLGFNLAGITTLGPADTADAFDAWLARGYAGEMHYLPRWAEKRRDSRLPFPSAISAIVVALDYGGKQEPGPIARYARGNDYHDVLLERLNELHRWIEAQLDHAVTGKAYVDTGPLLERDLARRAGLGWFGKNTNLIHPRRGSFFFLGALLLTLDLTPDTPFESDHCGRCTRCLDACPTHALVAPRVLDATRCISYLTIEARGPIPEPLRPLMGELVYGCDICQEVCPYNHKFSQELSEPALAPHSGKESPSLVELMRMSPENWREFSRGSPIKRTKRRGFLRNVAVALGNQGSPHAVSALADALSDEEPLVRGHVAWALGKIGTPEALEALERNKSVESDPWVLEELRSAMDQFGSL